MNLHVHLKISSHTNDITPHVTYNQFCVLFGTNIPSSVNGSRRRNIFCLQAQATNPETRHKYTHATEINFSFCCKAHIVNTVSVIIQTRH
jgi:hypothetical protein